MTYKSIESETIIGLLQTQEQECLTSTGPWHADPVLSSGPGPFWLHLVFCCFTGNHAGVPVFCRSSVQQHTCCSNYESSSCVPFSWRCELAALSPLMDPVPF